MTEAGNKWANEHSWRHPNIVAALPEEDHKDGEFWIRAFCDETEKLALAIGSGQADPHSIGRAFDQLKRELLGEK